MTTMLVSIERHDWQLLRYADHNSTLQTGALQKTGTPRTPAAVPLRVSWTIDDGMQQHGETEKQQPQTDSKFQVSDRLILIQ